MRSSRILVASVALAIAAVLFATCSRDDVGPLSGGSAATPLVVETTKERPRPSRGAAESAPDHAGELLPGATLGVAALPKAIVAIENYKGAIAAPKHLLRGRVVDAAGRPLADLKVVLVSAWIPSDVLDSFVGWPPQAQATVATGSDGTFELPYWEGGPRELQVFGDSELPRWTSRNVADDREVEVVLGEAAAGIVIRTVAADGTPVVASHVTLCTMPLYTFDATYSEVAGEMNGDECVTANGVHRFSGVPTGRLLLEIEADGFAALSRWIEVRGAPDETFDVKLVPGRTLRGRVVEALGGAGIAKALVHRSDRVHHSVWTDADGGFALEHTPVEPRNFQSFRAVADGFADTTFLADGSDTEFVVRMPRPAEIKVRCVDGGGAPLAHVVVAVSSDFDATPPGGMRSTMTSSRTDKTEADGRISIYGLHPGSAGIELRVRFFKDGIPALEATYPPLAAGETRDLGDVVLAPTLTLRGTVLDAEGTPAAGATVVAAQNDPQDTAHGAIGTAVIERGGRRAECGADGSFTLMGLTPGLWDVFANDTMDGPGRLQLGVDPRVGTLTLRLPKIVALEGRVVDAKGTPLAGVSVTTMREEFGLRMMESVKADADGRFRLDGFAADAPEVDVSVRFGDERPAQTFKVRPGVATTELRLR